MNQSRFFSSYVCQISLKEFEKRLSLLERDLIPLVVKIANAVSKRLKRVNSHLIFRDSYSLTPYMLSSLLESS